MTIKKTTIQLDDWQFSLVRTLVRDLLETIEEETSVFGHTNSVQERDIKALRDVFDQMPIS